jgi:hypothetical protein
VQVEGGEHIWTLRRVWVGSFDILAGFEIGWAC